MCVSKEEVMFMRNKERINNMIEMSGNGTITATQITKAGISRNVLKELCDEGVIYRF